MNAASEWSKYAKRNGQLLQMAVENSNFEMVRLLLDVGVNVDAKIGRFRYSKGTVLHLAAASSRLYQMAELLLDRGASVSHRDVVRRRSPGTALHFAVSSGLPDTVRLLLQRGAQIDDYAMNSAHLLRNAQVIEALRNEGEWQRVRKFVKFLHMSGFASQQWSVRQGCAQTAGERLP
jgi:ankyrin repeat protein